MNSPIFSYLFLLALIFIACSRPTTGNDRYSGTGSEIPNGLILYTDGSSVHGLGKPGTIVYLYSPEHDAYALTGYSDTRVINDTGAFSFEPSQNGNYNLIAYTPAGDSALIIYNVPLWSNREFEATLYFSETITISGNVLNPPYNQNYVYIPGTPYVANVENDRSFKMSNLASGDYSINVVSIEDSMVMDSLVTKIKTFWIYKASSDTTISLEF